MRSICYREVCVCVCMCVFRWLLQWSKLNGLADSLRPPAMLHGRTMPCPKKVYLFKSHPRICPL